MLNRKHPKDVGMTYFSHLKFAWNESKEAWCMGVVMFVHGLFPWIWDWKFSHGIAYISDYLMESDPDRFPDRQSAEEHIAERKKTETTVKKLADTEDNLFNIGQ